MSAEPRLTAVASRTNAGWIAYFTLVDRDVRRFMAVWVQTLLGPAISSLIFMAIFTLVFARRAHYGELSYEAFLAPGLILMTMMQNAFANSSTVIVSAKMHGTISDLLMAPVTALHVVGSLITGAMLRATAIFVVMGSMLWVLGYINVDSWPVMLFYAINATYLFAVGGVLTGFLCSRWEQTAFITSIIITPLTMLSGTFYAVSALPESMRAFALFNPLFHVMNGFRAGMTGFLEVGLLAGAIALPLVNLTLTLAALSLYRRGVGLRH